MKKLLLAALLLAGCHGAVSPVVPVVPVNPNAPKHATGFNYKPGQKGLMPGKAFALAPTAFQIPKSFSWVAEGFGTPVRDQGQCGSCWAFGSTQMLDGAVKIYDGKDVTLSEQEIVAYDSESSGCSGGNFAGDFLVAHGLVLDSACPYTGTNGGCSGGQPSTYAAKPTAWSNLGDGVSASPTVAQIQQAILQYGVVSCDVAANSSWDNYSGSGVLSGQDSGIDHIVAVVGWDGQGNWIMKNSWGASWGQAGYAPIPYGNFSLCQDAAFLNYSQASALSMVK